MDWHALTVQFEKEWFNTSRWWFHPSSDDDTYLSKTYGTLLSWEYDDAVFLTLPLTTRITWIIIHDQLPRHVYRTHPQKELFIDHHMQIAIHFANMVQNELHKLNSARICFTLLPYRHTQQNELVFKAIFLAWEIYKERPHDQQLKRFLKAAYNRAPTENQLEFCSIPQNKTTAHIIPLEFIYAHYRDVLCSSCQRRPIMFMPKRDLVQHVKAQLQKYGLAAKPIAISVSGGVDSMVLSYILKALHASEVIAVHIDYANRSTSAREAAFVRDWCNIQGIPIVTRRIEEINRPLCMAMGMRSTYETYTRRVRFNTYRAAIPTDEPVTVALGHNYNDTFENILTNICHHTKYDNLLGMTSLSKQDGIAFWRPLLGITKDEICEFARGFNIPYLYDSTLKWTQRGKIRDMVYPAIAQWDKAAFGGLHDLSRHMTEMYGVLDSLVDCFLSQTTSDRQLTVSSELPCMKNELFWRRYIHKLIGLQVSHASLHNFIERLELCAKHERLKTKIMLHKTVHVVLNKCGDQCVLRFQ